MNALPLRARKAAATRLGLVDAAVQRLRRQPFDELSVKELCRDVGISEPTFFNHFDGKHDLLVLYVQLWSVEVQQQIADAPTAYDALARLFEHTAEAIARTPRLMAEIIAHQMRATRPPKLAPTRAELALRFGESERAPRPLPSLVEDAVERAVRARELPGDVDREAAAALLGALFFGAPAAQRDARAVRAIYASGLRTIWHGLGGRTRRSS
jgi:AcrR family transcriptional regulator